MYMNVKYYPSEIQRFCCEVLEGAGVRRSDAEIVARNLTAADRRGIESHGIMRLPSYVARLEAGVMEKETVTRVVRETRAIAVVDAANGLGAVASTFAMKLALRKSEECGVGIVGVKSSNHYGIAGFYAMMALSRDMIGLSFTNAVPAMAPWGGRAAYIGTNPICVAIPAGVERPIVYDGATSVVAKGKIMLAQKKRVPIPPTWAADGWGRPTTDPDVALSDGVLLPFGGYKGSGIALALDVLCGVLPGGAFGFGVAAIAALDRSTEVGHLFAALDIAAFSPVGEFKEKVDRMIREVRATPPAEGIERIYVPGEIEFEKEVESDTNGIAISQAVLDELHGCASKYGVELMKPVSGSRA
jgi:LDH2 family malate/lactate/ureidoglycolate dehydrogenase